MAVGCGERFQVGRVGDLVVVGEAPLGRGILGKAQRQGAEPARRQPHEPCTLLDPALLQRRIEPPAEQAPELGAKTVDGGEPIRPTVVELLALQQLDEVRGNPAGGLVARPDEQLGQPLGRQLRQIYDGQVPAILGLGLGHDQDLGAIPGDDRHDDGSTRSGNAACFRQRAPGLALAAALDEAEQLLAQGDQLVDGRGALRPFRSISRLPSCPDGDAKVVETPALAGGEVERLQLQGDSHLPRPAFVGQLERGPRFPTQQGRKAASANSGPASARRLRASPSSRPWPNSRRKASRALA